MEDGTLCGGHLPGSKQRFVSEMRDTVLQQAGR
jgi:hypothetical protein